MSEIIISTKKKETEYGFVATQEKSFVGLAKFPSVEMVFSFWTIGLVVHDTNVSLGESPTTFSLTIVSCEDLVFWSISALARLITATTDFRML
jgi:hypothetical protein